MAAKDPSAHVPQDLIGWGRLARELLIQAAKDVEGRGSFESKADRADAYAFFFSDKPAYVYHRQLWFGLAGITVPENGGMKILILNLVSAGRNVRKNYGPDGGKKVTT